MTNRISFVIPCFNEGKNIKEICAKICHQVNDSLRSEIIFIDDGSTDNTWEVINELKKQKSPIQVRGIKFTRNYGHQNALLAGYAAATGDCVITLDADMEHPPSLIPKLIHNWVAGHTVVLAQRKQSNKSFFKNATSKLFHRIYNLVSTQPLIPGVADYRLLDKSIVKNLLQYPEKSQTIRTIIATIGGKLAIVPYTEQKSNGRKTRYTIPKMCKLAKDALLSNTTIPLYAIFTLGLCISLVFGLGFMVAAISKYILHQDIFSSAAIFGLFIVANNGVIILLIGILALYVSSMHTQLLNRPNYHIDEEI